MATTRKVLSEQERAERRQADREFTTAAIEQMQSSERWQQWLGLRSHFRRYSVTNQLLIAVQRPTATRVAGFRAWLALGYAVNRCEHAIRIWAPCPPSRKQIQRWRAQGSDPDREPRTYFKLVPVFAQDQVSELPPPAEPLALDPPITPLTGEDLAFAIPPLISLAAEIGSRVEFEAISSEAQGYFEPASRRIALRKDIPVNAQAKTLVHEVAHALLRAEPAEEDPKLGYASEELVVESVAFTVAHALGLDASGYSIPYLTSWSQTAPLGTIERTAGLIDRIAARIENALLPSAQQPPDKGQCAADRYGPARVIGSR